VVQALIPAIDGPDPVWGLRRAALWIDLGDLDRAEAIVTATVADLRRRQRQDRESVWIASRRAWAEWLARALSQNGFSKPFTRWTEEFRVSHSDPWVLRDDIADALRIAVEKRREDEIIKPGFEPGRYTDPSNTIHIVSDMTGPQEALRRLVEDAAIPHQLDFVNVLGDCVQHFVAATKRTQPADWLRVLAMMRRRDDAIMDGVFGRAAVAAMEADDRMAVIITVRREISFWRSRAAVAPARKSFIVDRVALLIEVLARLSVCVQSDAAEEVYLFALELGAALDMLHVWLYEPIQHLAEFALAAVAPARRGILVGPTLDFPTPAELNLAGADRWPAAYKWLSSIKLAEPRPAGQWDRRIDQLLVAMERSADAEEARARLAILAKMNCLTGDEAVRLGKALWAALDAGTPPLPILSSFYPSVLLWLPHPVGVDVEALLRRRLFEAPVGALDLPAVGAIGAALRGSSQSTGKAFRPTPGEVADMFDRLVAWRPKVFDHPMQAAFEKSAEARIADAIAAALCALSAHGLIETNRTEERLNKLFLFLDAVEAPDPVVALIPFVEGHPSHQQDIADRVRRAQLATKADAVRAGCLAVVAWARQTRETLPPAMIERMVSALETRRWPGLAAVLLSLRALVRAKALTPLQIERLEAPLNELIEETDYARIALGGGHVLGFSLVRQGCVLLAHALQAVGAGGSAAQLWLATAGADPLPEVRYVLNYLPLDDD
jgi:hypothetical protein